MPAVPQAAGESLIAEFRVPAAAWQSVPTPVEVVLQTDAPGPCRLGLWIDGQEQVQQQPRLRRGRTTVSIPVTLDHPGLHPIEVRAEFAQDRLAWNNRASALVDVPMVPRVVIVSEVPAAAHPLRAALESNGLLVRVVAPKDLAPQFSADCIVLENVAARSLGAEKLRAMEQFVRGGGAMVFTGGRRAYAPAEIATRRWSRSSRCTSIRRRNIRPSPWSSCWTTRGR